MGSMTDGKRMGSGILFDPERDEIVEGNFEMNKKSGEGMLYRRNGKVLKGEFRNNCMEGAFENVTTLTKEVTRQLFNAFTRSNASYIAVNKMKEIKV